MRILQALREFYHKLPQPPSTNYLCKPVEPNPYEFLPANPVIYDIGSKEGRARYAFGNPPSGAELVCVDVEDGDGVDLVADAHDLHMVVKDTVDLVTCVTVLNHLKNPQKVVREIHRILKPGGLLYINVPFVFSFDGDPSDFYRFSYQGLEILCADFEKIGSGFNRGPASTIHHLLVHFCAILFSFNSRTLYGINVDVFKWMLFWIKYLDKVIANYKMAYIIHAGAYFIGRKPVA